MREALIRSLTNSNLCTHRFWLFHWHFGRRRTRARIDARKYYYYVYKLFEVVLLFHCCGVLGLGASGCSPAAFPWPAGGGGNMGMNEEVKHF